MIITILGARPQFIKAAVVSKALKSIGIPENIIHTGQHYDENMSRIFWDELGIPAYERNLNVGSGSHGEQTAQMIVGIERYLQEHKEQVKAVLLYGDTNSTLAGAITASKMGIRIIHVESGLRSFNRAMPEEINRIVTDHLSDLLFCPSIHSVDQLKTEGIIKNVYDVGDVMFDALIDFGKIAQKQYETNRQFWDLIRTPFILLTIHRPSNTDNPDHLRSIFRAIQQIDKKFIWPVHPRTQKILSGYSVDLPSNIELAAPFSYFEMLLALQQCEKVITDSGGVQKESYWSKKPCITLREETEWVETMHHNWNILTGFNTSKIIEAESQNIDILTWINLYGDGNAADKVAQIIQKNLYAA